MSTTRRATGTLALALALDHVCRHAPWRAELVRTRFIDFEAMAPPYDESFPTELKPSELALQHAAGKAGASAVLRPDAYILAADQTAEFRGRGLQKPADLAGCASQLRQLRGDTHYLHSAVALYSPVQGEIKTRIISVTLTMKALSPTEIENYVLRDRPVGCVGGYKFECGGKALFHRIDQEESAIVGLPLNAVDELLDEAGFIGRRT